MGRLIMRDIMTTIETAIDALPRWRSPTTRQEIEDALDGRALYAAVNTGKWWLARRNGKTQTWKRSPERFRIPIKFGFRGTAALDEFYVANTQYLRVAAS